MLLAIDVGNTNTVFAIHDGTRFIADWRCATEHQRTADEYYVWLHTLMELRGVDAEISQVIVSSVVPQVVFNLRLLSDRYYKCRPLVVGKPDCALPVDVRVDADTQVGADRRTGPIAQQAQPMLFVAFLGGGDGGQDLALLAVVLAGQVTVDRGFGALVGQVPAPATQILRAGRASSPV